MADIFEEVEEGLRQDRAARLWKKYGIFAYLAAALLIGGVALNEYLQHRTSQSVEESALAFEQAREDLSEQNWQAASDGFETLAGSDARIAPLASNFLAEARLQGNADRAAAVAALEEAAGTDTPMAKLSLLKAAYLKSETMTREETEAYLGPLLDEESQFAALGLELVAAKAVSEQDYETARQIFNDLRFLANVPQGVQQRAASALNTLPATEETVSANGGDGDAPETTGEQPQ